LKESEEGMAIKEICWKYGIQMPEGGKGKCMNKKQNCKK